MLGLYDTGACLVQQNMDAVHGTALICYQGSSCTSHPTCMRAAGERCSCIQDHAAQFERGEDGQVQWRYRAQLASMTGSRSAS